MGRLRVIVASWLLTVACAPPRVVDGRRRISAERAQRARPTTKPAAGLDLEAQLAGQVRLSGLAGRPVQVTLDHERTDLDGL